MYPVFEVFQRQNQRQFTDINPFIDTSYSSHFIQVETLFPINEFFASLRSPILEIFQIFRYDF